MAFLFNTVFGFALLLAASPRRFICRIYSTPHAIDAMLGKATFGPRRYYKAAHWTRGWADREKAARFVAEVTAFGRAEEAYTRDFHAAARKIWGPRGF